MSDVNEPGAPAPESLPVQEAPPEPPPAPVTPLEAAPPAPAPSSPVPAPSGPEGRPGRKHHVAPALIPLHRLDDDDTFRFRPLGDVSPLATDLARLGQLFPIELRLKPPDRFQVITGFRRVAALKLLQRDKVLARLHTDLSDDEALLLALAEAVHSRAVTREELALARERLERDRRLSPAVRDMLDKALADDDGLAPEHVDEEPSEEVDADELAADATVRLSAINQDLALLADVFKDLEPARRDALIEQLKYSAQLVEWLEGGR